MVVDPDKCREVPTGVDVFTLGGNDCVVPCPATYAFEAVFTCFNKFGKCDISFETGVEGKLLNDGDMFWIEKTRHGTAVFFCPGKPVRDMPQPGFTYAMVKSRDDPERVEWETVEGAMIQRYLFHPFDIVDDLLTDIYHNGFSAIEKYTWEEVK